MDKLFSSFLVCVSFFLVAFGTPSFSYWLSIVAGAFGYALFWHVGRGRFWMGTIWFTAVQAVQLNWIASPHYMGPFIWVVYGCLVLALGLQFGWLTALIRFPLSWKQILAFSGFWVWMEWVRLFFLTGFTWNPIGLCLSAQEYSIQFASVFGVYGLCFWVVFTNLVALKDKRVWMLVASVPYFFGVCHSNFWKKRLGESEGLSVALVQTALRPEQRDLIRGKTAAHISPIRQWERILSFFQAQEDGSMDLIVLPEGALPGGVKQFFYPLDQVRKIWSQFGDCSSFPEEEEYIKEGFVTNGFWLQTLANHYNAEVIVGLDDGEKGAFYNAAFHFIPRKKEVFRYEKQILIPGGEYIPASFLAPFFLEKFGIASSFTPGSSPSVSLGKTSLGLCICLEETYGNLVRKARKKGANLLVNLTNDVWFPETRLPWHHLDHGRLRAAENGTYLLRACNTGVTGVINCFGKLEANFPVSDQAAGVLRANIPLHFFPTLYTIWGDVPILFLSFFFVQSQFRKKSFFKKKLIEYRTVG